MRVRRMAEILTSFRRFRHAHLLLARERQCPRLEPATIGARILVVAGAFVGRSRSNELYRSLAAPFDCSRLSPFLKRLIPTALV